MKADLETKYKGIVDSFTSLWDEINKDFDSSNVELTSRVKELEIKNAELSKKYNEAQSKIDHIESQLESTVRKMEDLTKDGEKDLDALKLLDIYLVLIGEVFSAASHVRLLFILHGEKTTYTIDELAIASGYPGLQVRKIVHELRNTQIVSLNEDTNEVELLQKFL